MSSITLIKKTFNLGDLLTVLLPQLYLQCIVKWCKQHPCLPLMSQVAFSVLYSVLQVVEQAGSVEMPWLSPYSKLATF